MSCRIFSELSGSCHVRLVSFRLAKISSMRKGLADDEKELYEKYKNDPNAPSSAEETRAKGKGAGPLVHRLKNRALVIEQQSGRGGDRSSDFGFGGRKR